MKTFFHRIVIIVFLISLLSFYAIIYADDFTNDTVFTDEDFVNGGRTEIPECYMQGVYNQGNIMLDMIYNINREYQKGNISEDIFTPLDTYCPYLDKSCVNFFGDVQTETVFPFYYVKDRNSRCVWYCTPFFLGDSHISGFPCLTSPFIDGGIYVNGDMEELDKFVENSRRIYKRIYENVSYIKGHLEDSQYGGYCYQKGDEKVHIYLLDESRREELETQGIVCEKAEYSLRQMNEKTKELWDKRQELGIVYIRVDAQENQLIVTVKNREAKEAVLDDPMLYIVYLDTVSGLELTLGENSTDVLMEYLQEAKLYTELEKYSLLVAALDKLKDAYPEYDYTNLFYRIAKDFDYERYLDFPKELNEYVDQLPVYQKTACFMDEIQYGDPLRLEVKRMLREYKKAYPKMTYQDIYETYIKEIEEDNRLSSAEKLCWYLYDKYTIDFDSGKELAKKDMLPTAVFGIVMLVFGGIIVCVQKRTGNIL